MLFLLLLISSIFLIIILSIKLLLTTAIQEKLPGDVERYNEIIQHETIRVAVCGMIENDSGLNIPLALKNIMEKTFLQYYDYYESVAMKKMAMTGLPMQV